MNRPFLLMSGEFRVTQKIAFLRDHWSHTMSTRKLVVEDGELHREGVNESLKGVVYYARTEDVAFEIHNLELLIDQKIPCWPDPRVLRRMTDRHSVMQACAKAALIGHPVMIGKHTDPQMQPSSLPMPFVLKLGQSHRGEDKHLITRAADMPTSWDGLATMEPFFEGRSCRILLVGDRAFGVWYDNENSWIKNSAGAETEMWPDPPAGLVRHARSVADLFGLEIAGVDYVISQGPLRRPHFLEINQFPGLDVSDEVVACVEKFLNAKMDEVEKAAHG
jgi:glutathione synthase/RimK-type ligase-like ATP-grasp enzyme